MPDARTIDVYDARAADYAARFDGGDGPGTHLQAFMALLPEGAHVLDLGCGPGGSAAHMAKAGFVVDPVDASREMVRVARAAHGLPARIGTFDDLDAEAVYDGVWANFSLLHAPREALPAHLAAIHRALRTKGVFHIGMKTGTGTARDPIDRLYTYLGEDEYRDLLIGAGFDILKTTHGSGPGLADNVDPWIIHLCRRA